MNRLVDLKKATELLKGNKVEPSTIESDRQAKKINDSDRCGGKWKKGDKYYILMNHLGDYYF